MKSIFKIVSLYFFLIFIFLTAYFKSFAASNSTIVMSKTNYNVNETIRVTYTGTSAMDWIGIYEDGVLPSLGKPSITWKYTSSSGQPNGTMDFTLKTPLPGGKYNAFLCKNNEYVVLAKSSFTISEPVPTIIPKSVSYNRTATKIGYADGTITITPASNESSLTGYVLYWGDSKGKLKGYSPIAKVAKQGKTIKYSIVNNTLIPPGTTKIMVYSVNGNTESTNYVQTSISSSYIMPSQQPLYKFQVLSDIHIMDYSGHTYNANFNNALQEIKALEKNSAAIVIVGDLTQKGLEPEYDQLRSIVNTNKTGLPPIYYATGNHDLAYSTNWTNQVNLFKKKTGMTNVYFDKLIHNQQFIFLGSQGNKGNADILSDQQTWLTNKLSQASSFLQPTFLFLHQPFKNTVAGTIDGHNWAGVIQDTEVRNIINKNPQIVLFTGHTHWELDAKGNMFDGKGTLPNMFNVPSSAYLWTDEEISKTGSQGYYVEVYSDKVIIKGRDFQNKQWVSSAQFIVDLTKSFKNKVLSIPTTTDGLISQKDKIQQAINDINSMSTQEKNEFKTISNNMNNLIIKINDMQTQVSNLKTTIEQLPEPKKIQASDIKIIETTSNTYNSFTTEQKKLIPTNLFDKLNANVVAASKIQPPSSTPINTPKPPELSDPSDIPKPSDPNKPSDTPIPSDPNKPSDTPKPSDTNNSSSKPKNKYLEFIIIITVVSLFYGLTMMYYKIKNRNT